MGHESLVCLDWFLFGFFQSSTNLQHFPFVTFSLDLYVTLSASNEKERKNGEEA